MKKGFTLVELLATIVILAIIVVLATNGYKGVTKKVKQTSYENKVSLIETKAAEYGEENGSTAIFVEDLVKGGYIEADDEAGNVYDPRDNSKMNCYIVNISYENDNNYGTYTNEEAEINGVCDTSRIEEMNNQVKLSIHEAINETEYKEEAIEENKWTKENVILIAEVDEEIKGKVKRIEFNGEREEEVEGNFEAKNKLYIRATQIINTVYKVRIETEEENGDTKVYTGSIKVMIDKQAPIIYDRNINIAKENEWSAGAKEIVIKASDESGSGIYGYYIGKTADRRNCADIEISEYKRNGNEENSYREELTSDNYYICVRDNVGNTTDGDTTGDINIGKIDEGAPSCELEAMGTQGSNGWYTSAIDIRFKTAEDLESGIGHTILDKPKITEDTTGTTITGTVVDKVGNQNTCSITVKKDSKVPTVRVKNETLTLGNGSYEFKNNIEAEFGISGGSVTCNPASSRGTGVYTVTCVATGGNGLTKTVSFTVKHNYPARYVHQTCERECNCKTKKECTCGHESCDPWACWCGPWPGGCCEQYHGSTCCKCSEVNVTRCETCEYDCSYYDCPEGGSLSGTTCYY